MHWCRKHNIPKKSYKKSCCKMKENVELVLAIIKELLIRVLELVNFEV